MLVTPLVGTGTTSVPLTPTPPHRATLQLLPINSNSSFLARYSGVLQVVSGLLWLIGGYPARPIIWSQDGVTWSQAPPTLQNANADARQMVSAIVRQWCVHRWRSPVLAMGVGVWASLYVFVRGRCCDWGSFVHCWACLFARFSWMHACFTGVHSVIFLTMFGRVVGSTAWRS
jgi:hypothetical protein